MIRQNRQPIQVAVGILMNSKQQFLLQQRRPLTPYAGYWEFPGGKVEQGETIAQALKRELFEELGILVQNMYAWCGMQYSYPHALVRLHIYVCHQWQGNIKGREGQTVKWEQRPLQIQLMLPTLENICYCMDYSCFDHLVSNMSD